MKNKGFTLIEIIVVLVIIAILAAAMIPTMLGFIEQARLKAMTAEVRAVYLAAQAYVSENQLSDPDTYTDDRLEDDLEGTGNIQSGHALYDYLQDDATGTITEAKVTDGKVKKIVYVNDKRKATLESGKSIKFTKVNS